MCPGGSTICKIERAVTLLPLPLSPTRHSVSPWRSVKETSFTAWNGRGLVANSVQRLLTSRTGVAGLQVGDVGHQCSPCE